MLLARALGRHRAGEVLTPNIIISRHRPAWERAAEQARMLLRVAGEVAAGTATGRASARAGAGEGHPRRDQAVILAVWCER